MLGKIVVITGATSGIGRIAAEQLAARGARIVLSPGTRSGRMARLSGCAKSPRKLRIELISPTC